MAHDMSHGMPHGDSHGGHYSGGFIRWLETTNHKDIGIMYLIFGFVMLFVGGAMILAVRAELFQPGLQFMQPEFFNQLITLHGLVMVFGFAMPVATGLANYMLPMIIGAPDMALPRLNNWGFWILPPAAVMLTLPFFWACLVSALAVWIRVGLFMRRCRSRADGAWTLPFLPFICSVCRPFWGPSMSSSPSSTCVRLA